MKKQTGITLIALIITIIILLLLAGVALNAIIGKGSLIKNAEEVVNEYDKSITNEQTNLNKIDEYLNNKTDQNPPIVIASESVTITKGDSHEISEYFNIEQNGNASITQIIYQDTCHTDNNIENTSILEVGEHIITCIVTKANGLTGNASILIKVKAPKPEYTEQSWTTAGTYTWICPEGVERVRVAVCAGGRAEEPE